MAMERMVLAGKYVDLLRRVCDVLCSVSPQVIRATSVTITLDSEEDVVALAGLVQRLAEEYELCGQTKISGRGVTAYFRRWLEPGER
ncbi:MAG: hypothetical protein HY675_17995 [Chloroflexi bacterium]|nr:hypothetical protein [Chloroflexota bacterium]